MTDLEGFDPDDIIELEAIAEQVVLDSRTFYRMEIIIPHDGAEAFIVAYNNSLEGDEESILFLMQIMQLLGTSIAEAMDGPYSDIDDEID